MKRVFLRMFFGFVLLSGCVEKNEAVLDLSFQVESIVNFALIDSNAIMNNIEDTDDGRLVRAIVEYNEKGDANVFETVKKGITDSDLIKRITILQNGIGTQ